MPGQHEQFCAAWRLGQMGKSMIYITLPILLSSVSSASVFFLESMSCTLHHPSKHFHSLASIGSLCLSYIMCSPSNAPPRLSSSLLQSLNQQILHQTVLIISLSCAFQYTSHAPFLWFLMLLSSNIFQMVLSKKICFEW